MEYTYNTTQRRNKRLSIARWNRRGPCGAQAFAAPRRFTAGGIDPAALARAWGVAVEFLDLGNPAKLKGALARRAGGAIIFINANMAAVDREYTLAHELGHFINGRAEAAADRFADIITGRRGRKGDNG